MHHYQLLSLYGYNNRLTRPDDAQNFEACIEDISDVAQNAGEGEQVGLALPH